MLRKLIRTLGLGSLALFQFAAALAAEGPAATVSGRSSYVLADSIGLGLHLEKLEAGLQAKLGGPSLINYDAGRSITGAGSPQGKSALASVAADRQIIARASVIIIILGMEQHEASFADSQQELMRELKIIAPQASYYWVDIGATISIHAANWNARNTIIHDNAGRLGYSVISRYKAIFGPDADPLNIRPGQNFPGWGTEPGYGGPGNVHGFDAELSRSIMAALDAGDARAACGKAANRRSYILGDSIAYGLQVDGLALKLQEKLGGVSIISYDGGRSISHRGSQIEKSALESVEIDRGFIASAHVVVIMLGTNQLEPSFAESQRQLMQALRAVAPHARYYWVDIGATLAAQVDGWSARNKSIYDNAAELGYSVISRYKAIFGPSANPLRIVAGQEFPASMADPGWSPDKIHGASAALSKAILDAVSSDSCAAGN
ncbi:MAG: SGNH/GDSL hydrolase family protein [Comamonadaceae bacterium]